MLHTRRELLIALAGAALLGCTRGRSVAAGLGATGDSITHYPFSRADIETFGRCLGVTLGDGVPGIMFLTRHEGADLRWESTDHISFVTRNGRLVATRGMRRDVAVTHYAAADPLVAIPTEASGAFIRHVDLTPGDHRAVRYESRLEPVGEQFLTVLERTYRTARFRETLEVKRWQWRIDNHYWIDLDSRAVIRSIQHIAPDSPSLTIDLLGSDA